MKIHPTQRAPQTAAAPERESGKRSAGSQVSSSPATQVQRSSFARSLENATPGAVRSDVVEEVRAALADGSFEASVDIDSVLDGLLADL